MAALTYEQAGKIMDALSSCYAGALLNQCPLWDFSKTEHFSNTFAVGTPVPSKVYTLVNPQPTFTAASTNSGVTVNGLYKLIDNPGLLRLVVQTLINSTTGTHPGFVLGVLYSALAANAPIGTAGSNLTGSLLQQAKATITAFSEDKRIGFFHAYQTGFDNDSTIIIKDTVNPIFSRVQQSIEISRTGSAPPTNQNLCVSPDCLYGATCNLPLTNDASNIQRMSIGGNKLGVRLEMAFTAGSENSVITINYQTAVGIMNNNNGIVVRA